jgi:hypothetical protein
MSVIANLKPIEFINSVLQPLGLQVSSTEQMISKLAWGALVGLTLCSMLPVEGGGRRPGHCPAEDGQLENCKNTCWLNTKHLFGPYYKCLEEDQKLENYENTCWLKTKHLFDAYSTCKEVCTQTIRTNACYESSEYD